MIAYDDNFASS